MNIDIKVSKSVKILQNYANMIKSMQKLAQVGKQQQMNANVCNTPVTPI